MADKVTPLENYDYSPRVPDLFQIMGSSIGVGMMCVNHVYKRLPVFHKPLINLPLYIVVGFAAGTLAASMRDKHMDRKMRLAEAYMQEHPEMFVEAPPKKYGDVLWAWSPRR